MMTCGRARRLLWPDTGPREATAEIVAAREHVTRCDLCRHFLEDMRRISRRLKASVARPTAPVEVRDRLFKTIARARTASAAAPHGFWRRRRYLHGLAAGLLLLGSWIGYQALRGPGPEKIDPLGSIVEDRLRSQNAARLLSSDSLEVVRWLTERLPFAVQIPLFPEARLTGARVLLASHLSGAVVEYAVQGRVLTYYVLRSNRTNDRIASHDIRLASRDGYRVASWVDAGLTHALVATLPGPKLVEFARYCIHQMMATPIQYESYPGASGARHRLG